MTTDAAEIRLLSTQDIAVLDRVDPEVFDLPVQRALAEQYLCGLFARQH